jgi:WD40 repeat protein
MVDTSPKAFEPKPGPAVEYPHQLFEARFSPCGRLLCAAGYDGLVGRWEVGESELRPLAALAGHSAWVTCIAFQPAGELLFSADSWGKLCAWRYAEESPQPAWSQAEALLGWIRGLAVSPDGKSVAAVGNDRRVRLFSAADGKPLRDLSEHPPPLFSVAFHPDGKSLATGDLKGIVRQINLETGKVERELDGGVLYKLDKIQEVGGARQMAFDEAGEKLVVAGIRNATGGFVTGQPCVLLFDWKSGKVQQEMAFGANDDGFIYDARFHDSGFVMAASCAFPGKGRLWFWKPGEEKPFYVSNIANGRSVSLHPDKKRLAYLTCLSANGNGRQLKGGEYEGGRAKIHILEMAGGTA